MLSLGHSADSICIARCRANVWGLVESAGVYIVLASQPAVVSSPVGRITPRNCLRLDISSAELGLHTDSLSMPDVCYQL